MKIKAFTIKVPKKLVKGRIEPGTRHGSRPHKMKDPNKPKHRNRIEEE